MPELPEVETIVCYLRKKIVGKKITKVEVFSAKQFPQTPSLIEGAKIKKINRFGKMLVFVLDHQKAILTHLKLTGQLIYTTKPKMEKSTRIIIHFNNNSFLLFNDLRKFGWMKVEKISNLKSQMLNLGIEPLEKIFTVEKLREILAKSRRPVKLVLMDQEKIVGIGNIYANEALFEARISPLRPANSLKKEEVMELKKAIVAVLKKGIRYQGTSAADEAYIQPSGQPGRYQKYLKVYQRAGEKCFRCKTTIKKTSLGGRGTFFCPVCQH